MPGGGGTSPGKKGDHITEKKGFLDEEEKPSYAEEALWRNRKRRTRIDAGAKEKRKSSLSKREMNFRGGDSTFSKRRIRQGGRRKKKRHDSGRGELWQRKGRRLSYY